MKISINKLVVDYEGKPVKVDNEELNFKKVFSTACNSTLPTENLTAEKKNELFQISLKLYGSDEVDFTVNQLATIKDRVGKVYSALVYGRTCELIDAMDGESDTSAELKKED